MARKIQVEIIGDASSLERAFGSAKKSASSFQRGLDVASKGAAVALGAIGIAGKIAFDELNDATRVTAQTNAVIKSTGGIANVTAEHVDKLSDALLRKSGIDDEAIKSGENMLLTFTNIRNRTGENNAIFDRATKATIDMTAAFAAMGKETSPADMAQQLGKALNDPATGMSRLQRIGVTFTESQKKAAKAMMEAGNVAGAQKIILRELEKEFGGSAEAAGKTFGGQLSLAKEQALNFSAELLQGAIPTLASLGQWLQTTTAFLGNHTTATKIGIGVVAALAAGVLALNLALKVVAATQAAVTAAQWAMNAAMAANPIGLVVLALVALGVGLTVAWKKSETFRNVVTAALNAVKGAAQTMGEFFTVKIPGAFQAVLTWARKNWPEIATIISGPFAPLVALATDAFGIRSKFVGALHAMLDEAGKIAGAIVAAIKAPINALIGGWNAIGIPGFHVNMPGPIPDVNFPGVSLPDIPMLAAGGIVTRPTLAMIGERGPEAVIPLRRGMAGAGAPIYTGPHYHLEVGRIEEIKPNETEMYFRRMERLGL